MNPVLVKAPEALSTSHAGHEQNCPTSAVHAKGSSQLDPFSATTAGIAVPCGPLGGGPSEAVSSPSSTRASRIRTTDVETTPPALPRHVPSPPASRPAFLVTIDTEADNLWAQPRTYTTRNAAYIPRFQALCEEFALKPTYLTDWRMAGCAEFITFARDILARGAGEIGMHVHAWDTPPLEPLTHDDDRTHPYLIEYSDRLMREKVRNTTSRLEDALGVGMASHRAGRWSFDARYAGILADSGYLVDCSVTPLRSWRDSMGDPKQKGGTDYRHFPDHAYWLDLDDVSGAGDSALLEVPMTVLNLGPRIAERVDRALSTPEGKPSTIGRFPRAAVRRLYPQAAWLRPTGQNRGTLLRVVERVLSDGRDYAEFMLHSSEFMPGGSPTFRDAESIERLFADLRALFGFVRDRFVGLTLREYHDRFSAQTRAQGRR